MPSFVGNDFHLLHSFFVVYVIYLFLSFLNLGLEIGGEMNLAAGIQVAQLALKHRQNKKQQQRIIVFAGRYLLL